MIDLFLKFPDEETALTLLYSDEQPRFQAAIDLIGVIYKPTGETLQGEDGPYPEMAPIDGWHVNTRGTFTEEQLAELQAFVVTPTSPVRVWA
jgi:hypothetical protein